MKGFIAINTFCTKIGRFFFTPGLMVFLILAVVVCGRKSPPVPASYQELPVVGDVTAGLEKNNLRLSWTLPECKGNPDDQVSGFFVYRYMGKKASLECKDCPVQFQRVAEIPLRDMDTMLKSKIIYQETLLPGQYYYYRVSCYSKTGDEGDMSKTVKIDYTNKQAIY